MARIRGIQSNRNLDTVPCSQTWKCVSRLKPTTRWWLWSTSLWVWSEGTLGASTGPGPGSIGSKCGNTRSGSLMNCELLGSERRKETKIAKGSSVRIPHNDSHNDGSWFTTKVAIRKYRSWSKNIHMALSRRKRQAIGVHPRCRSRSCRQSLVLRRRSVRSVDRSHSHWH